MVCGRSLMSSFIGKNKQLKQPGEVGDQRCWTFEKRTWSRYERGQELILWSLSAWVWILAQPVAGGVTVTLGKLFYHFVFHFPHLLIRHNHREWLWELSELMPIKVPRLFLLFAVVTVGGMKVVESEAALPAELRPTCEEVLREQDQSAWLLFSCHVWLWGCRCWVGWSMDLINSRGFISECRVIKKGTRALLRYEMYNAPWNQSWVSKEMRSWGTEKDRVDGLLVCVELRSYSLGLNGRKLETWNVLVNKPRLWLNEAKSNVRESDSKRGATVLKILWGRLPWWSSGWKSCQCRGHKPVYHNYWSPRTLGLCNKRSHRNEESSLPTPAHHNLRKLMCSNEDPVQPKIFFFFKESIHGGPYWWTIKWSITYVVKWC